MTYGYAFNKEERENLTKGDYTKSKSKMNFDQNIGNILILLTLIKKLPKINFTDNEKKSYEKMVKMWYTDENFKTREMKENVTEILREQAIIAAVSNWEGYFADVSEIILIDPVLKKIYENKEKFIKFLNAFNLKQDFANEMLINGYQFNNLGFAGYIKSNDKINYQNIENLKKFLNLLYDIDIVNINEKNWTGIVEFIKARHDIVHNKYNKKRIEEYSENKIENILINMSELISKIDEILFRNFIDEKHF